MKVLVFGDMRSPHAQGWVEGIRSAGMQVITVPSIPGPDVDAPSGRRSVSAALSRLPVRAAHTLRSLEAIARQPARSQALRQAVTTFRPDVVHALRITHEGLASLTALKDAAVPVVLSSWGQDFVYQAAGDPLAQAWLRRAMPRAAGLIVDVEDDLERARQHGLGRVPTLVAAANFGLKLSTPRATRGPDQPVVVTYTRGLSNYVNYRGFLEAIPGVLARTTRPVRFIGIGLSAVPGAIELTTGHSSRDSVEFTGRVSLNEFRHKLSASDITVSPATSDGMPISVLESIARGCLTLVGPLPQYARMAPEVPTLRVLSGVGSREIEEAILEALRDIDSRRPAQVRLPRPYDYQRNLGAVDAFYARVVEEHG